MGKNDVAWREVFHEYNVLDRVDRDGYAIVSAEHLKRFREPRLMAKLDHSSNLPDIFTKTGMGILPISRGEYILARFACFMPLEPVSDAIRRVRFPDSVQSIDPTLITSEAVAVNCALASGIFADFLGEERLVPTVSGRMGSGAFAFSVDAHSGGRVDVRVNNAQIEIDAALEGRGSLTIVEAKRDLSEDFIIRQLFYPYKTWEKRLTKQVRLVYMLYTNGVFSLYEYGVRDTERYNSLELVRSRRYSVDDTEIGLDDVRRVLDEVRIVPEPELPFPQADSFERIINLCELLRDDALTREAVTERYDFSPRQTMYYTAAGRYLGLVEAFTEDGRSCFRLTDRARDIFRFRYRERQLTFCACILEHRVFNDVYREWLRLGRCPDRETIAAAMKEAHLYRVGKETTLTRRMSTVTGWLKWVDSLYEKGLFAISSGPRGT